ncbi:hypothetical protein SCP_0411050 [Sparassis crispa]|uniref:Nephrocystin 3-like N-terminal domain-containing protein n=1 Tax=Sparassis crispa TaxID=139825 RepID=A0A401GKN6_9APHY|nr:hypothetical protein SCP_0411050 [Sparassis crispa]GBE82720.1 hypothetical protein SCP_0411050 [Sparassis crispa]
MSCFSVLCRNVHAHEELVDDVLNGVHLLLDTAGDALSAAPVGGLDTAASALSTIIEMVMTARGNDQAAKDLAKSIKALADLIDKTHKQISDRVGATNASERKFVRSRFKSSLELNERIENLNSKLEDLKREAAKISEGSFFLRCLRGDRNAGILSDLKEGIDTARKDFAFQGQVTIEALINGLVEKVDEIVETVVRLEMVQQLSKDDETLQHLPHRTDAQYRSSANEFKNGYLPGTRTELLDELEGWAKGTNPDFLDFSIYVLSGAAGTGKSTIAYEFAKRLENERRLGASFFFVRGVEGLNTTRLVFPTIAYQLAVSQPTFYPLVVKAARDHLKRGTKQQMDFELDELIIKPLQDVPADHPPVVIVIDAVDECTELAQDHVPRMLHLILQRIREVKFPLRVLITTRPEMHIEDAFQSTEFANVARPFKLNEIPRTIINADITHYLIVNVKTIRNSDRLLKARPNMIHDLTKKSEGLFIFATTAVNFLRGDYEHLEENLDLLLAESTADGAPGLTTLDQLYLIVLKNAFPEYVLDRPDVKTWIQQVLGCVALLQDHLSPKTLTSLVNVGIKSIHFVLARLGSVICLNEEDDPDDHIRPLHASFPQFLVDKQRCKDTSFYIDPVSHHGHLASACLTILIAKGVLRRNICRLSVPSTFKDSIGDLHERVKAHIPLHVQYACVHWATHLSSADHSPGLHELLKTFCSDKLIVWLEALSMMDRLDIAVQALLSVRTWYQSTSDADTLNLLSDGYRFVLEYFIPINRCPEHIYISALPMTPSSLLFDQYSLPGSETAVSLVTARDPQWGSCLRVVEGHSGRVGAAKFSPNGRWVVSCCWDRTVRTWDAASGTPMNIMRSHNNNVNDVDYSPNNQYIVSGSDDTTLRIWNAATGAPLHKLRAKHGNVFAVEYSPDGNNIISGSYNNALHLWDAQRGKKLDVVEDETNCINSVSFSRDGSMVVTASSDNIVRAWVVEDLYMLKKFVGHTDQAKGAAFFPDGRKVVSGASDKTVRIWDMDSEKCLQTLEGHDGRVFCVTISFQGDRIASGSVDNTICLWDAQTGEFLYHLRDHTSWVLSVSFSQDGNRLVSASDDQTVRIWDLTIADCGASSVGHDATVTCIVFSNDGTRVASSSEDATIIVWDAATGQEVRTLEGHTERIQSIAFSPDGSRIVSGGWDNVVRVWDVESGQSVMSLKGHKKGVEAVAYSPDGTLFASGANNLEPSIRLWNASDGTLHKKIKIDFKKAPIDMVSKLEFSPDSTKIYTKTINGLTYIWSCSTGEILNYAANDWGAGVGGERRKFAEEDGWLILKESGQKLCWLAGSKRAHTEDASACHGTHYAAGGGSGRFTLLDLSELVDALH